MIESLSESAREIIQKVQNQDVFFLRFSGIKVFSSIYKPTFGNIRNDHYWVVWKKLKGKNIIEKLDDDIVKKYAPNVVEGTKRLSEWSKSL